MDQSPDEQKSTGGSKITHARHLGQIEAERLSTDQRKSIIAHLERHLGTMSGIFAEIESPYVCLDLAIFPAHQQRPFTVVCTLGCSARAMAVSAQMAEFAHQEFLICLPPHWPTPGSKEMDQASWWPYGMLKQVARLAHQAKTFVAPATTIPNGDPPAPYADGTAMAAAMVWEPLGAPVGFERLEHQGRIIRISQAFPLTAAECRFKLEVGHDPLLELLERFAPDFAVVDASRPCAVAKMAARLGGEDGLHGTSASRPGGVPLSLDRLREWAPELFTNETLPLPFSRILGKQPCRDAIAEIEQGLSEGDAQPAMVVRLDPLVVAVHTDEFDAVCLLFIGEEHRQRLMERHQLKIGSRLLAVNTYIRKGSRADHDDMIEGPGARGIYGTVCPLIADFLSDDPAVLARMKERIKEDEWAAVTAKTRILVDAKGWVVRYSHPLLSFISGHPLDDGSAPQAPSTQPEPGRAGSSPESPTGPARDRARVTIAGEPPPARGGGIPGWVWLLLGLVLFGIIRVMTHH